MFCDAVGLHNFLTAGNDSRAKYHRSITTEELRQLNSLRTIADEFMLRKAYAWSVLRWRGYRVPAFEDLPNAPCPVLTLLDLTNQSFTLTSLTSVCFWE